MQNHRQLDSRQHWVVQIGRLVVEPSSLSSSWFLSTLGGSDGLEVSSTSASCDDASATSLSLLSTWKDVDADSSLVRGDSAVGEYRVMHVGNCRLCCSGPSQTCCRSWRCQELGLYVLMRLGPTLEKSCR
jgi:hypothetical protein